MDKTYRMMWTISLLVIVAIPIINLVFSIISVQVPDIMIRIMGIADICAIPVLIFSSIKLKVLKKDDKEQ